MTKPISLFLVCIIMVGSVIIAHAAGSASAGKSKSAVCAGCHGADGNSSVPLYPTLAGQNAVYLSHALTVFKEQKRNDPTMVAMASPLSAQDIADLSAYYAGQRAVIPRGKGSPWQPWSGA